MTIEAMKQALEALETCMYPQQKQIQAITSLRQAIEQAEKNQFNPDWDAMAVMVEEQQRMAKQIEELEQAEKQEPVGEVLNERGEVDYISYVPPAGTFLYTTPQPQREWVGLMDEEIDKCCDFPLNALGMKNVRKIEAKLRSKNK